MEVFNDFLRNIDNDAHKEKVEGVFDWIQDKYPELEPSVRWNKPMYSHHGTYIVGFSVANNHLAIAPEQKGIIRFSEEIKKVSLTHSKKLSRIEWDQSVNYQSLEKIINFNIEDKSTCTFFWRRDN